MSNNTNTDSTQRPVEDVLLMKELCSNEFVVYGDKMHRRALEDIDFNVKTGQVWGIGGNSVFEIKLFLEIIANVKPYFSGKCVLMERGMMRRKRVILPHVFYIGTSEMIYPNMNVLEFLMFVTGKSNMKAVNRQEQIFNSLIAMGLGYISLSPISILTAEEKAAVFLMVCTYSSSMLIVLNLPHLNFDSRLIRAIKKIANNIVRKGKSLIFSTNDCELIETVCTHTAFFADGRMIYQGSVDKFRYSFDKIAFYIEDYNIEAIYQQLAPLFLNYKMEIVDKNMLVIRNENNDISNATILYQRLIEAGMTPEKIRVNQKTVQNAYEEMMKQYDLQK